jgi:hypothetical protein
MDGIKLTLDKKLIRDSCLMKYNSIEAGVTYPTSHILCYLHTASGLFEHFH